MLIILISAIILFLDQLSKFLISNTLDFGESIPILKDIFHLTLIQNSGAAFGIFHQQTLFFIIVACVVIGLILISHRKFIGRSLLLRVGLALILGGALGNLVDRLRFGFVVDFLDFRIWPVFNIADTSICVGTGLFILGLVKGR